jgi:uncharacterized protein YkwD
MRHAECGMRETIRIPRSAFRIPRSGTSIARAGIMRHVISALCFLGVTLGCAGVPILLPAPSGGSAPAPTSENPAAIAADVVRLTNDARARNGLPALRTSAKLMEAARIHAQQMAAYQRSDHTISSAQYPTMQSRLQAVDYAYLQAAENVAWNQASAQAVLTSWMNSSGHRSNILDAGLTEIGAAMARSPRGEPYWIQVFGRPR